MSGKNNISITLEKKRTIQDMTVQPVKLSSSVVSLVLRSPLYIQVCWGGVWVWMEGDS